MVVGGAEIYRQALPRADKIWLTRVHGEVSGDVTFDLDCLRGWREISSRRFEARDDNSHDFTIAELHPPLNG